MFPCWSGGRGLSRSGCCCFRRASGCCQADGLDLPSFKGCWFSKFTARSEQCLPQKEQRKSREPHVEEQPRPGMLQLMMMRLQAVIETKSCHAPN